MLRILGSRKRLCDGLSRRDFLSASLGALTLGTAATTHQVATASTRLPSFGKAKRCILLYLYGAASQIETFDPKPDAPSTSSTRTGAAMAEEDDDTADQTANTGDEDDGEGGGLAEAEDWSKSSPEEVRCSRARYLLA